MNRYILLLILLILYVVINSFRYNLAKKRLYLICFFSVFLILDSGLRNLGVGSDTFNYRQLFELVKQSSLSSLFQNWITFTGKDPFYALFEKLFQLVFPYFRFFLLFVAILFFWSLGRFIYINVVTMRQIIIAYTFYIGLYYGFFSITAIRQTIAVAIIMFAYEMLTKKKIIWALILTILGAQFHLSAWVFVLSFMVPYINMKRFKRIVLPLSVIIIVFVYLNSKYLADFAIGITGVEDRFDMYLDTDTKFSWAIFGMYMLILIAIYLFRKNLTRNIRLTQLCAMYIIGFLLLSTSFVDNNAVRVALYFTFSMYVIVPEVVESLEFKNRYSLVFVTMMILMAFSIGNSQYAFFWQPLFSPEQSTTIQEFSFFN